MHAIAELFRSKEDWLMSRILFYAKKYGYSAYTSTLFEAWRASVSGLTEAVAPGLEQLDTYDVEINVDTDLTTIPVARFGLVEARRHRQRGVSLSMFLGLFVYYRQTYQDCLREFLPAGQERDQAEHTVIRLFDLMSTAFCTAWANEDENIVISDMAESLRTMTNEKNLYMTFVESLTSPAFFLAPDGSIKHMNLAAASLIAPDARPGQLYYENRMHAAGLYGRPVAELIPWLGDFVRENLDTPDQSQCSWAMLTVPKSDNVFRAIICKQPDLSGKFQGFSLVLQNETEQRRHLLQIARAKEELERTFDTISDLVFVVDTQHVLLRVNKSLAQRFNSSPEEIVGRTCQDVFGCHSCSCGHTIPVSDNVSLSYPNLPGNFLVDRSTLTDENGKIFGYVFVARDVTRLEHILTSLHIMENRYKSIFDNAQEGIFQSTLGGVYLNLNPAMARIFGFDSTEAMRNHYTDIATQIFVHPQDRHAMLQEGLETGRIHSREVQLKRQDGSVFWAEIGGRIAHDAHDDTPCFEGFLQDVNERKKLESQLLQTQKLEAIGQLAAGIAHEINTPTQYVQNNMWFIREALTSLSGILHRHGALLDELSQNPDLASRIAATREADTAQQQDFYLAELPEAITETIQGLERITTIVQSVKKFAHPGHDHIQLADMNELIRDTINVSRNEWKYVADLTTDLAPDLPLVPCLPHEIGQVLLNLIINASHAVADRNSSPDNKGLIQISTRIRDDGVAICVRDNGTGIPEHARPHIFEPFYTTKPVGKGTGQGLYLAYRTVVTVHGGDLNFETEAGKGTAFFITLPLIEAAKDCPHA